MGVVMRGNIVLAVSLSLFWLVYTFYYLSIDIACEGEVWDEVKMKSDIERYEELKELVAARSI